MNGEFGAARPADADLIGVRRTLSMLLGHRCQVLRFAAAPAPGNAWQIFLDVDRGVFPCHIDLLTARLDRIPSVVTFACMPRLAGAAYRLPASGAS